MPTGSVRIWYDPQADAYRVVTPFNQAFVDAIKKLVPISDRAWDASSKTWTITERFMGPVCSLAEKAFKCKATVVTKAQAQAASMPPVVRQAPLDSVILDFFKLLPFEAAQGAYRKAALTLHPDRGGSMESMSRLNAAWQRLETELYGRG